jgi:hypothetical protein
VDGNTRQIGITSNPEQDRTMQADSDRPGSSQTFILRPDFLYLHRFYREWQAPVSGARRIL